MGRWDNSTRRSRLPSDWPKIRQSILTRDGNRCVWRYWENGVHVRCAAKATEVDHIVPGDNHDPHNLRSLCHEHHAMKTAQDGGKARRQKMAASRKLFRKPPERHPGLL